jgi:hypothetical protein
MFRVVFPEATAELIPSAAVCVKLVLTNGRTGEEIAERFVVPERPTAAIEGIVVGTRCIATAAAYPDGDAEGVPQATGSAEVTVPPLADGPGRLVIDMTSTIDRVDITPSDVTIPFQSQQQFIATPLDADGDVVLTGNTWEWACGEENIASVDGTGLVRSGGSLVPAGAPAWIGSQGEGAGQFVWPQDVAVGPAGHVYVVDSGRGRLIKFDAAGNFIQEWGSSGDGPDELETPWAIAVDGDGSTYVADEAIKRFRRNGDHVRTIYGPKEGEQMDGLFYPADVAVDSSGNIIACTALNTRLHVFDAEGTPIQILGRPGDEVEFRSLYGLDIGPDDCLYMVDIWLARVFVFEPILD